jgi:kynurenine formamidase
MTGRGRMIDVSHTVEHGMVTYKGLPSPGSVPAEA